MQQVIDKIELENMSLFFKFFTGFLNFKISKNYLNFIKTVKNKILIDLCIIVFATICLNIFSLAAYPASVIEIAPKTQQQSHSSLRCIDT